MSVIEKLDEAIRLLHDTESDWGEFYATAINLIRDHGPAIRQALLDAEQLAAVRIRLPTKVETTCMAGMDAEEIAAFDSGYNAALDRAHLLLMASAAPANEALEPDSLGFGARSDAAIDARLASDKGGSDV